MALRSSLQSPAYTNTAASSSSLVTPTLSLLADPPVRQADAAALDYLTIEMVHTLRASASVATERMRRVEREMLDAGLVPAPAPPEKEKTKTTPSKERTKQDTGRESVASTRTRVSSLGGTIPGQGSGMEEEEEEEEALRLRLEAIGQHVGANITERLCRDRPRFGETLDAVKFVCKDLWSTCWEKQVDNLRTNHRGVYVLSDNQFKPISRISSYEGAADAIRRAKIYVAMPIGIIKGALARMGYQATVTAEIQHLPQCTFQVKLPRS